MSQSLYKKLMKYIKEDYLPMHMPGAKRRYDFIDMPNPYAFDITEIEGFDNLHKSNGVLSWEMERAARLFKADRSLLLVNGSTTGILSAICGACERGDEILVARNCHMSVYNALELRQMNPSFIYPDYVYEEAEILGEIKPNQVKEAFQSNPSLKALVITSPTYEGNVSSIREIADIVHSYGAILIVDEAHGAHFPFSKEFPTTANELGADAVITSLHKTLPAFTATGLLHLNGDRINKDRVEYFWNIYQTTSPSYLAMASISACMDLIEDRGEELFTNYISILKKLRCRLKTLRNIKLLDSDDLSKLVFFVDDADKVYNELVYDYHIQLEMTSARYFIGMTSLADTEEMYDRLFKALNEIDNKLETRGNIDLYSFRGDSNKKTFNKHTEAMTMSNAAESKFTRGSKLIGLEEALGKIVADNLIIYPPGIPELVRGEIIDTSSIEKLKDAQARGLDIIGIEMDENGRILVRCL